MMTWPIAILPNDCPLLSKRTIHCPSADQCNRLLFCVLFVLLLSFVYLIVLFFLWMHVGVLFCFCMHIHVLVIILLLLLITMSFFLSQYFIYPSPFPITMIYYYNNINL